MNQFATTVAFCALPALLGLAITPLAARLLEGIVRPGRWTLVAVGWAVVSSLAFALWLRHGLDAEIAANVAGPFREDGMFMILGFVFWNGVLILTTNLVAIIAGAVLRRRRAKAARGAPAQ